MTTKIVRHSVDINSIEELPKAYNEIYNNLEQILDEDYLTGIVKVKLLHTELQTFGHMKMWAVFKITYRE